MSFLLKVSVSASSTRGCDYVTVIGSFDTMELACEAARADAAKKKLLDQIFDLRPKPRYTVEITIEV